MYKVFVNNRPLTISKMAQKTAKVIPFQNSSDFHVAIDLLRHSAKSVNIYGENVDNIIEGFCREFTKIYAAGGVVLNQHNEMLWIYRMEKWDLPKGKMEKDEAIEQTAVREVEEECGISGLTIQRQLPTTYHMYFHKEFILKITHWFEMKYENKEKPVPQIEEGISEVKWIKINNLDEVLANTYANILELIKPYNS